MSIHMHACISKSYIWMNIHMHVSANKRKWMNPMDEHTYACVYQQIVHVSANKRFLNQQITNNIHHIVAWREK